MLLKEWNEVIDYAIDRTNLSSAPIKFSEYTVYDGRRGLMFELVDNLGNVHSQICTGIRDTANEYCHAIHECCTRLEQEVI